MAISETAKQDVDRQRLREKIAERRRSVRGSPQSTTEVDALFNTRFPSSLEEATGDGSIPFAEPVLDSTSVESDSWADFLQDLDLTSLPTAHESVFDQQAYDLSTHTTVLDLTNDVESSSVLDSSTHSTLEQTDTTGSTSSSSDPEGRTAPPRKRRRVREDLSQLTDMEKEQRRVMSNRASAERSRQRRIVRTQQMEEEIAALQKERAHLLHKLAEERGARSSLY